jgi:hypothetical protein
VAIRARRLWPRANRLVVLRLYRRPDFPDTSTCYCAETATVVGGAPIVPIASTEGCLYQTAACGAKAPPAPDQRSD